ncbi:hypothetical protein KFE98_20140 [bacterium SCSIO 12741]|nr:hypothetical protein KFE98_20140 [bacterium SCSIO 12741]
MRFLYRVLTRFVVPWKKAVSGTLALSLIMLILTATKCGSPPEIVKDNNSLITFGEALVVVGMKDTLRDYAVVQIGQQAKISIELQTNGNSHHGNNYLRIFCYENDNRNGGFYSQESQNIELDTLVRMGALKEDQTLDIPFQWMGSKNCDRLKFRIEVYQIEDTKKKADSKVVIVDIEGDTPLPTSVFSTNVEYCGPTEGRIATGIPIKLMMRFQNEEKSQGSFLYVELVPRDQIKILSRNMIALPDFKPGDSAHITDQFEIMLLPSSDKEYTYSLKIIHRITGELISEKEYTIKLGDDLHKCTIP